jgi:hypothetical protein
MQGCDNGEAGDQPRRGPALIRRGNVTMQASVVLPWSRHQGAQAIGRTGNSSPDPLRTSGNLPVGRS